MDYKFRVIVAKTQFLYKKKLSFQIKVKDNNLKTIRIRKNNFNKMHSI